MLLVVVVVGVRSLPFDIFGNVGYAKKVLRFDNILYLAHKALAAAIAPLMLPSQLSIAWLKGFGKSMFIILGAKKTRHR